MANNPNVVMANDNVKMAISISGWLNITQCVAKAVVIHINDA